MVGPVPMIVRGYCPGGVAEPTFTVIVEDAPADTDAGEKRTVLPSG